MEKLVSSKEIEAKAKELVLAIKDDKIYKEYMELREKLRSNETLMNKINEIKKLQKEYVKSAYLDKEVECNFKKLNEELKKNSLYKDYLAKEEKINTILININEGLNLVFDDILNKN